ncbi:MAG: preprotein translocase subunit YajC [Verrucomicrobia bacterium]|nr:MAG: preprotein translocase subunit YajC [Verrucomicrobiota bacterium]
MIFPCILAQAAASPASGSTSAIPILNQILPLGFIVLIFYFLVIRPQQRKQKEHQRLLQNLKTGDKVVTSAGIHGLISNVKDKTIILKVADNVKIEFDKASVTFIEKAAETAGS